MERTTFRGPEQTPQPFTVVEAEAMERQVLVAHEAGHAWFVSRVSSKDNPYTNYALEERFVNAMSQKIADPTVDLCEYTSTWRDRTSLEVGLCEAGVTAEMIFPAFRVIAAAAAAKGSGLTVSEVVFAIDTALSTDEKPIKVADAFINAGLF